MPSIIFTSSDQEPFLAPGRKEFQIFNKFQITDPQIISSKESTMDMSYPMKLDIGITKLIDEVCASDINTPDISVFDEFGSQTDVDFNNGFQWDDTSLSSKSANKNSTLKNCQGEFQDLFCLSPTSPSFFVDNTYKDERTLTTPEKDEDDANKCVEKVFSSDIENGSETLPFMYDNRNLTIESNMPLPVIADADDEQTMASYDNALLNQQDCSHEFSNFYNCNNLPAVDELPLPNSQSQPGVHDNNDNVPLVKQELFNFASLCNFDGSDLVTSDQRAIEDINTEIAVNSTSNILSDAIQNGEINDEAILSTKEMQEKVDSFLNFFSSPLVNLHNTPPECHLPTRATSNPKFVTAREIDILNSFKSSPFGKKSGNAILKNIKIIVPSEHTRHFAVTASPEDVSSCKPRFFIQSDKDFCEKKDNCHNNSFATKPVAATSSVPSSSGIITLKNRIRLARDTFKDEDTKHFAVISSPQDVSPCKSHFFIKNSENLNEKKGECHNNSFATQPVAATSSVPSSSGITTLKNRKRTTWDTLEDEEYPQINENSYDLSPCDTISGRNRKRGKLSLKGLNEAEKYRRIREQNNIASKKCRENKKKSVQKLSGEIETLSTTNALLNKEMEQLVSKVSQWKRLWRSLTEESTSRS